MDTRATIDVTVLLVDLLDQGGYSGIFSLMWTGLALFPGIIAALGNFQRLAEKLNRIMVTLLCDELKFYARLREKMPIAFFNMSRSCRKSSFSRFKWRFSSSSGRRCPLPGMHLFRVLQSADTNG